MCVPVCVLQVCVWRVDHVSVVVVKTPICVIHTHTELVMSVSFNEDGSRIATTCRDRRVRVLEPRTGHILQVHQCLCVCISPQKEIKSLFRSSADRHTGNVRVCVFRSHAMSLIRPSKFCSCPTETCCSQLEPPSGTRDSSPFGTQ